MRKDEVFNLIDLLILGRYLEFLRDTTLQLRYSSNQGLDFFTSCYDIDDMKDVNYFEIEIDNFGAISCFGCNLDSIISLKS